MKKHKTKIIWGAVIVALLGLMYWGGGASSAATWEETDVSCIPGGHQNLAYHIHADLLVSVDGEGQTIPTNTGISSSCMAEVHTHNQTGYIHAESVDRDSIQTLGDFFAVWGEQTEREGYEAVVMVNGEESSFEYQFRDGDDIQVSFNSEGGITDNTATTSEDSLSTTSASEADVDATSSSTSSNDA
jgi:hypothetical protein